MPILNGAIKNEIEQDSHEMNLISLLKIEIEQNSLEMNLISLLKIKIEQNSLQMNLISSLKKIPQIIVSSQFLSTAAKNKKQQTLRKLPIKKISHFYLK
ncbi:hypothetical protein [Oceanobacillus bengalensis]|uniref:Uncharacterized protein n=1 Tax=Oceanobacillus bengalensis TaxID=1435466 RepID=A0A494Z037_9BACI|nr:hypothetical protein [Oceanobacillus bengalensis]RKQ15845.1 hypothetical protein D8M05_08780 [Oceanobacillus bengalensis]